MKETFQTTNLMVIEDYTDGQMVQSMKARGKKDLLMALAYIVSQMEELTTQCTRTELPQG